MQGSVGSEWKKIRVNSADGEGLDWSLVIIWEDQQEEKNKSVNSTKSAWIEEQALDLEWLRKWPQAELYLCSVLEMWHKIG